MFSKKLLIPLLSLSLLVTPAYSSHAAENTEAAETSVEGQGMLSPSSSSESSFFRISSSARLDKRAMALR